MDLVVDGFGSPDLSAAFLHGLADAGVRVRVFDPGTRVLGHRLNVFRRMHRKIVVVDGRRAIALTLATVALAACGKGADSPAPAPGSGEGAPASTGLAGPPKK